MGEPQGRPAPRRGERPRPPIPTTIARSFLAFLLWSAAGALALAAYAVFVEPSRIVVERPTFEMPARTDARKTGRYRLAFVSDFDMTGAPGRFERRVRRVVNSLTPDLVAFGGDLYGGDRWRPSEDELESLGEWLAGFRARDGVVVVWGEQELRWAERLRDALPDGVRELHWSSELHDAGDATLRITGPEGLFAPLWIDPRDGGRLRAAGGRSVTLARYTGADAGSWTSFDLTSRLTLGRPGDGIGLAVLEDGEKPGYRFQVSPTRLQWTAVRGRGAGWHGATRAASTPIVPGRPYVVRVRVEPGDAATFVRSRVWADGEPEPRGWPIEIVDQRPERPRRGSVAVLTGGRWSGSDEQSWDFVRVRDLDGRVLLDEEFRDDAAFHEVWENPAGRPRDFDATIVVGHRSLPFLSMPSSSRDDIDLLLAGHTHGGQVRLPMFGPLYLESGLPRRWSMGFTPLPSRDAWLYTSRGIGVSRVPIRFLCPPEVTLMEIILRHRPPV